MVRRIFERSLNGAHHHKVIDAFLGHSPGLELGTRCVASAPGRPPKALRASWSPWVAHSFLHPAGECAISLDAALGPRVGRGVAGTPPPWRTQKAPQQRATGWPARRMFPTYHAVLLISHTIGAQTWPDLLRRDGTVDVAHPKVPEGINPAFTIAAGAPTVADSPIPLALRG